MGGAAPILLQRVRSAMRVRNTPKCSLRARVQRIRGSEGASAPQGRPGKHGHARGGPAAPRAPAMQWRHRVGGGERAG